MTRAALYNRHVRIADRIANDFHLPGAERDDVLQEARVGLWVATGTWDEDRGAFPPYASHLVRTHLIDMLRMATRKKHRVLTGADRDYVQLELVPAPNGLEETVVAREHLRDLIARYDEMVGAARRRRQWTESKRRSRARAAA